MSKAVGILDALHYAERFGSYALTVEERQFMKEAKKKKGCPYVRQQLTVEEILRVMELGEKCRKWENKR